MSILACHQWSNMCLAIWGRAGSKAWSDKTPNPSRKNLSLRLERRRSSGRERTSSRIRRTHTEQGSMRRTLELSVPNLYVTVQPGITLKELDEHLEQYGLVLTQEQGSYKVATVGGSIATA